MSWPQTDKLNFYNSAIMQNTNCSKDGGFKYNWKGSFYLAFEKIGNREEKMKTLIKEEAFLTEGILAFRKAYLKRACWRGVWCNQI